MLEKKETTSLELREYQRCDVEFLKRHHRAGLFNEQRTGKTPTVITAIKEQNISRSLVVVPASMVYVWESEIHNWSNLRTFVCASTDFEIPADTEVVVINYEKLRGREDVEKRLHKWKPQCIVVDEAHRMKDRKSKTFKTLSHFKYCEYRYCLTGTPAYDKPWDVWTILNFLKGEQFSSYWNFIDTYFVQKQLRFGGRVVTQPAYFKPGKDRYLQAQISMFCTQRKRADVMDWQTSISPTMVILPPSPKEYQAVQSLEKWFEYEHIVTQGALDTLVKCRQICLDPEIAGLKGKSTKTEWIQQYIKDYPNEHILIFSESKQYLKKLESDLIGCYLICGDTKKEDRARYIDGFQNGDVSILLCQTQACKEGLTLDNADTCVFASVFPPASDYQQAADRFIATTREKDKPKKLFRLALDITTDRFCQVCIDKHISQTDLINSYSKYLKGETS